VRWLELLGRVFNGRSRVWAIVHANDPSPSSSSTPRALTELAARFGQEGGAGAALVVVQTAPPFCGAEALEAALLLLAHLHGAQPGGIAKELQAQAGAAAAAAVGAIGAGALKQPEAQRLAQAAGTLRHLAPRRPGHPPSQAAGFRAAAPALTALVAKALGSPTLTLKLWAVKEGVAVVKEARALPDDGDGGLHALAETFRREGVAALLLGDGAHEEVLQVRARARPPLPHNARTHLTPPPSRRSAPRPSSSCSSRPTRSATRASRCCGRRAPPSRPPSPSRRRRSSTSSSARRCARRRSTSGCSTRSPPRAAPASRPASPPSSRR
jgi:hypothetical protein